MSHYVRFLAAALFSLSLIVGDLHFSAFDELRGGMSWVLVPFRAAATLPGDAYRSARGYLRAREQLLGEKAALEREILEGAVRMQSLDFHMQQNDELRRLLALRQRLAGEWLAAEVVRNVAQSAAQRLFLNKGVADGVVPGQAAVDRQGVIGQVIRADVNTCVVAPLTSQGQWISTRLRRSNLLVILRGAGGGRLAVEYVSNDADIRPGDELLADGGHFPAGYPVAVVEEMAPGVVYQRGWARPLSDFSASAFALLYVAAPPEAAVESPH